MRHLNLNKQLPATTSLRNHTIKKQGLQAAWRKHNKRKWFSGKI